MTYSVSHHDILCMSWYSTVYHTVLYRDIERTKNKFIQSTWGQTKFRMWYRNESSPMTTFRRCMLHVEATANQYSQVSYCPTVPFRQKITQKLFPVGDNRFPHQNFWLFPFGDDIKEWQCRLRNSNTVQYCIILSSTCSLHVYCLMIHCMADGLGIPDIFISSSHASAKGVCLSLSLRWYCTI